MGLSVDGETSVTTFWVTTIVQILESSSGVGMGYEGYEFVLNCIRIEINRDVVQSVFR